jgi:DNA-directed RNA polymerase specialized sigma24 family protein
LTPRVRTAVVLRYYEDQSQAETARIMGCSVSTVDKHVARGLGMLRHLLGGDDEFVPARIDPQERP